LAFTNTSEHDLDQLLGQQHFLDGLLQTGASDKADRNLPLLGIGAENIPN